MKKLLAIFMALLLLASSMFVMTSCNDNEGDGGSENGGEGDDGGNGGNGGDGETDTKVEYKVVVKDQNGAAIEGAKIFVLNSASAPISTTPTLTDAAGEAKFSLVEGSYTAMIMGGDNYELEGSSMKPFSSARVAEFTVKTEEQKEKLTYTIRVVDQDGNAVAGVRVQACTDACTPFKNATDESGETSEALEVKEEAYKAQLTALPEGYTEEVDEDSNPATLTKYAFDADRTVTIVLVKN